MGRRRNGQISTKQRTRPHGRAHLQLRDRTELSWASGKLGAGLGSADNLVDGSLPHT